MKKQSRVLRALVLAASFASLASYASEATSTGPNIVTCSNSDSLTRAEVHEDAQDLDANQNPKLKGTFQKRMDRSSPWNTYFSGEVFRLSGGAKGGGNSKNQLYLGKNDIFRFEIFSPALKSGETCGAKYVPDTGSDITWQIYGNLSQLGQP